ncbi:MAG: terminase small subunit [Selenomonadaceae bacterium]|nr:terminase small subunit [Selenomonadaceae bacterium]
MNERQKRFVDFYVQTGNASEAARLAGYSKRIANRIGTENLSKPVIRREIERRLDELKSSRTADTQEILEHLTSVIRGEVSEEVVTNSGKKFVAKVTERDRLKAAEMLLKVQGAFRDKIDVKVDTSTLFVETLQKIWSDVDANS